MIVRNDVWTKFAYLNVVSETRSTNKLFSFHWKLIIHSLLGMTKRDLSKKAWPDKMLGNILFQFKGMNDKKKIDDIKLHQIWS